MNKMVNGDIFGETPEEIAERERQATQQAAEARHLPMSEQEAIRHLFQSVPLSPNEMWRAARGGFYPEWDGAVKWEVGWKCTHGGMLWKRRQPCNPPEIYAPGDPGTESLWESIEEEYTGDEFDPIPYRPGMALEQGKHYREDGVVYVCTRDTGNPVYNALRELVGIYVEAVNQLG